MLVAELALIPGDGFDQPVAETGPRTEAELTQGTTRIQAAARLAVRFRGVPPDFPLEAAQLANHFHHGANGDFLPGANVDRLRFVIMLSGEHDGLGGVA